MNGLAKAVRSLSPRQKELLVQRLRQEQPNCSSEQISPRSRQTNVFPLSFAQQRLWFLEQLEPGGFAYNITIPTRLTGRLDIRALKKSLHEIALRHEVLRTTFSEQDGGPVQVIAPAIEVRLPFFDLRECPESRRSAELELLLEEESKKPFDFTIAPPWRCSLIGLRELEHVFTLTMHHIVTDAWSTGLFFEELGKFYAAFVSNRRPQLTPLTIQYADYAVWQREWFAGERGQSNLDYWKRQLAGPLAVLDLPFDHPRPETRSFGGGVHVTPLTRELTQSLKQLGQSEDATLFMTLLASFSVLLHRYCAQDEILIGTDVANRGCRETEALIGFFINLLVLRIDLSGHPAFRSLLARVREVSTASYVHQEMPFDRLVVELGAAREANRSPLFQVLFVMQNAPQPLIKWSGLQLSPVEMPAQTARFDLAVFMEETEAGLTAKWNYSTDLFEAGTISLLAENFATLLTSIVAQPRARINSLEMQPETERLHRRAAEAKLEKENRGRFKKVQPKVIRLVKQELVDTSHVNSDSMPLVLTPGFDDFDLADWASSHRPLIQSHLLKYGALLFRGFNLSSVRDFERCASAVSDLFPEYGDLPREKVSNKVYGSTPYPSNQSIMFHNESSHLPRWPMKIWFFCLKAAAHGGETPIVDCRRVYELLSPKTRDRFSRQGLMYVRNYTEGLDVRWQDFFRTQDRAVVEEQCARDGIEYQWSENDVLQTRRVAVAVTEHPDTGEPVFFNQIQLHHSAYLQPSVRESLIKMLGEECLPRQVYYGDGNPIEDTVIGEIDDAYRRVVVTFKWIEGDMLLLDNMLTAHGRNSFAGERKIVVAMGEMFGD